MKKLFNGNSYVMLVTFDMLARMFGSQVTGIPVSGQRNHIEQNKRGRDHITGTSNSCPATQMHFVAVSYKGIKLPIMLIDGYHRLHQWFEQGFMPFDNVFLTVHTIEAKTLDEAVDKTDKLQRTIDSPKAVKRSADTWSAAIRDAGLVAKSDVYSLGLGASYLLRVIAPARNSIVDLRNRVKHDFEVHTLMDQIYQFTQSRLSRTEVASYFHPGVAVAVFKHLVTLGSSEQRTKFAHEFVQALRICVDQLTAETSDARSRQSKIASSLMALANPAKVREMKAENKNREQYYDAVHKILAGSFPKPAASKAKKLAVVK